MAEKDPKPQEAVHDTEGKKGSICHCILYTIEKQRVCRKILEKQIDPSQINYKFTQCKILLRSQITIQVMVYNKLCT